MTAKMDGVAHFGAFKLPHVVLRQPRFCRFDLCTVLEVLLKKTVLVANAVPVGRNTKGRKRIHKAGRQTPQPAVAQRCIRFIRNDCCVILPQRGNRLFRDLFQPQIDRNILNQTADQKLHRQVVHAFAARLVCFARALEPRVHHVIAQAQRQRHPPVIKRCMLRVLAQRQLEMTQDRVLEIGRSDSRNALIRHDIFSLFGALGWRR